MLSAIALKGVVVAAFSASVDTPCRLTASGFLDSANPEQ